MKAKMLTFTKQDSPIHRLTGATKLILFVVWSVTGMITYDTRCLIVMLLFSLLAFRISKVQFQDYAFVLYFILIFFLLNHIAIFIFLLWRAYVFTGHVMILCILQAGIR